MDNNQTINLIVQGQKMTIPKKFTQISEYLRGLQALGFEDEQDISIDSISKQTFTQILSFYQLCNYQQVFIKTPIRTTNIHQLFPNPLCEYLQKYPINSSQYKSIVKGCQFLGCKNLLRVCAARCACYLYFQDSKQAFEEKQKQLGIKLNVQFQDNQKFKKLYPFMNN